MRGVNNESISNYISKRNYQYVYNPERRAVVAGENTHQYEIDTTYIHFFRYWQSAE